MAWIGTGGGIRCIWFYRIVYAGFAADSCFKGDGVGHVQSCVDDVFFAALLFGEKLNGKIVSGMLLAVAGSMGGHSWRDCGILSGGGIGWGEVLVFCSLCCLVTIR